ncbi:hypothetical protein THAOC_08789, partial [Thalassiosira oceanica]
MAVARASPYVMGKLEIATHFRFENRKTAASTGADCRRLGGCPLNQDRGFRSQLVVSAVDYRSLSDTTTEAALRTAHAAAALQPTSVSRVVTREAFPTAEDLGEGGHGDGPTSSTTDSKADGQAGHNGPLDSFEFSFDGGGDDVLTDQLDASLITHLEVGPAARAQSHTAGAEEPPPPPRPVAAAAPKQHGRRRPRNKNGTFQS